VLLVDFLDCGDIATMQLYCGTLLLHQDITLMATLGPIWPPGLLTGYGAMAGRLWSTLPTVLISCPLICCRCQYDSSCHLVTHAWQKFIYMLWYHSGTNGDYVDIWCIPSAMSVPYIQSNEDKVLGIHCLLAYFLNCFVQLWLLETFLHSSYDHLSCSLLSYTVNSLVT
jgi:hypothetical protein